MMSIKLSDSFIVKAPIEEVYAFISNSENLPLWSSALNNVTKTSAGPIGLGTHFREEGALLGRKIDSRREITEYEPPTKVSFTITEGAIPGTRIYTFRRIAEGTEVNAVSEGEVGWFMEMLAPLFSRLTNREFAADVQRLIGILESGIRQSK